MRQILKHLLENDVLVPLILAGIAAAALGMAFMAEYVFGLEPCVLCLYQRVPYAVVIALGFLGALSGRAGRTGLAAAFVGASGVSFLLNSALAFYHTGVEQKWWRSILEGCAVPQLEGDLTDVLAQIKAAPVVRCDEIPWVDPIFGLSMANYNVVFCFGLAGVSLVAFFIMLKRGRAGARDAL